MGTIELYHGDCLEVMKTLPDRSVDLFLTDLPFGCLKTEFRKNQLADFNEIDDKLNDPNWLSSYWDVKIDLPEFWNQVKRLRKDDNTPILMFCTERFGNELYNSNSKEFRYALIWNKNIGTGYMLANKMPMRSHECIYIFAKKGAFYNRIDNVVPGAPGSTVQKTSSAWSRQYGCKKTTISVKPGLRCPLSVINFSKSWAGNHPTEKPVELYKWLIARYSPDGGVVLDPTAGSFNSCIAAAQLGREAIGIEKDDGFYKKAEIRFGLRSPDGKEIAAPSNEH